MLSLYLEITTDSHIYGSRDKSNRSPVGEYEYKELIIHYI